MAGLVEEIQGQAIDPMIRVGDLLLKVKLAAAKLKLSETIEWVDRELTGYNTSDDDIPAYRWGSGQLMIYTPRQGVQRATGDPEMIQAMATCGFRESVASLESMKSESGGLISIPANTILASAVNKQMRSTAAYSVYFNKNVIDSILGAVRAVILDWAIKLEKEGILGEGITFTVEEKKKAADAGSSVYINYGVHQQGNTIGDHSRNNVNATDKSTNWSSKDIFEHVAQIISSDIENAADRKTLLELIRHMDAAKGTSAFQGFYQRFVTAAANYMTILGPFLPALTEHLPKILG